MKFVVSDTKHEQKLQLSSSNSLGDVPIFVTDIRASKKTNFSESYFENAIQIFSFYITFFLLIQTESVL